MKHDYLTLIGVGALVLAGAIVSYTVSPVLWVLYVFGVVFLTAGRRGR